jgi:3-oxoadipate enol-lactonase
VTIARVNGIDVHYQLDDGDASILALSHSLGTSSDLWRAQLAGLSPRFRLLTFDIRGHGTTEATPGPYTVEQLAADFIALLDALRIETAHYCGVSLGGAIGQWLGARAPRRIDRLVLANTAARFGTPDTWNTRIATVREHGTRSIANASIERWFTPEFAEHEQAQMDSFRQVLLNTPLDGYIGCCAAIRDVDHRSLASEIVRPTLVIAGSADRVTSPDDAAWLAGRIPKADLLVLPAAHLANVEAADQFNAAVSAFLSTEV